MHQSLENFSINSNDPNLIAMVTDIDGRSKNKLGRLIGGLFYLVLAFISLLFFLYMTFATIGTYIDGSTLAIIISITIAYIIFGPLAAGVAYVLLRGAIFTFNPKASWYFLVYPDRFTFINPPNKPKKRKSLTYPLENLKKCLILKTEHIKFIGLKGIAREQINYTVSVHLQYKADDAELHYLYIEQPNKFENLNKVITYLQNVKKIPVHYAFAEGEMYDYEKKNERELAKQLESEPIVFEGDLAEYSGEDSIRRVNWGKALEASGKYIRYKKKEREDRTN